MHGCTPICKTRGCWGECFICGFEYPIDSMTLHYKKERYVCCKCDDCPSWSDFMEDLEIPEEETCDNAGQPVSGQGGQPGLPTIVPPENPPPEPPNPPEPPPSEECDEEWDYIGRGIYYGQLLGTTNQLWHVGGDLRFVPTVSFQTIGNTFVDGWDDARCIVPVPFELTRAAVRITGISGALPCYITVEAYKNTLPTGFITGQATNAGDKAFATGSVTYAAGDSIEWAVHYYDTNDNLISFQINDDSGKFPIVGKEIKIIIEFTAIDGLYPSFQVDHVFTQSILAASVPNYLMPFCQAHPRFTQQKAGIGFFTPVRMTEGFTQMHYINNIAESLESNYQTLDDVPISDVFLADGPSLGLADLPLPFDNDPLPTDLNMDSTIPTMSLANMDSTGRVQWRIFPGDPVTSLNTISYEQDNSFGYVFTEHPRTQYIVAGHDSTNIVGVGTTRRAELCGIFRPSLSNLSATRAATYLFTKGKFHHFNFYSMYAPVVGQIRCRLIIDGSPLFELFLEPGERVRQYADMFICVDGELAWWEFTKMSGAGEALHLVITCLLGPEGV